VAEKLCNKIVAFLNFYFKYEAVGMQSTHPSLPAKNRLFSSHTFCAVCIFKNKKKEDRRKIIRLIEGNAKCHRQKTDL
jgi:hypothetical protein